MKRKKRAIDFWTSQRWLWFLMIPLYITMVVYAATTDALAPRIISKTAAPYQAIDFEIIFPTSDPDRKLLSPTIEPFDGERRKININEADAWMLTAIPGIGDVLAERIILFRDQRGKFEALDELTWVEGIGAGLYETLKKYLEI